MHRHQWEYDCNRVRSFPSPLLKSRIWVCLPCHAMSGVNSRTVYPKTPATLTFANGKSVLLNVFQHTTLIFFLYILPNGKTGVLQCGKYNFNHTQKLVPCNKEQTQHQVQDKYVNSNKNRNCSAKINVRRKELTLQWCRLATVTYITSN